MEILLYYAPNTCALAPYVTLTEAPLLPLIARE
jgi:hypothetical protein